MKSRSNLNRGAMQRLLSLFIDNWWLKLLSIALAIIIYQSLKPDQKHNERNTNYQYRRDVTRP